MAVAMAAAALAGAGCGGGDVGAEAGPGELEGQVLVLGASSLTDAFTAIGEAFEARNPGVSVEMSFGSSSDLARQIQEGAPADVFASADTQNMGAVVESGEVTATPVEFAQNVIQIAVPAGNPGEVEGLDDFADGDLLIGLCAEEVPCGRFGREVLDNAGVSPAIDTNEPDVRSLLTKIESGDLDAGLVYRTDVLAAGDAVEAIEIPEEQNVVATYPIAPIGDAAAAQAFVGFVLSADGQAVLEEHGFRPAR